MGNYLSRKWLESMGISLDIVKGNIVVTKTSKRGTVVLSKIAQFNNKSLVEYYCFTYNKHRYKLSANRVIYALLHGECPSDKVVMRTKEGTLVLRTQKEIYHRKVWDIRR